MNYLVYDKDIMPASKNSRNHKGTKQTRRQTRQRRSKITHAHIVAGSLLAFGAVGVLMQINKMLHMPKSAPYVPSKLLPPTKVVLITASPPKIIPTPTTASPPKIIPAPAPTPTPAPAPTLSPTPAPIIAPALVTVRVRNPILKITQYDNYCYKDIFLQIFSHQPDLVERILSQPNVPSPSTHNLLVDVLDGDDDKSGQKRRQIYSEICGIKAENQDSLEFFGNFVQKLGLVNFFSFEFENGGLCQFCGNIDVDLDAFTKMQHLRAINTVETFDQIKTYMSGDRDALLNTLFNHGNGKIQI